MTRTIKSSLAKNWSRLVGRVFYKSSVGHDLKKIQPADKERIIQGIEATLQEDPRGGEPLHGEFEGLYKLRIGDFRVVYALSGRDVLVLRVRHRSKAYD